MTFQDTLNLWSKFEPQTNLEQATILYNAVINSPRGDVVEIGSANGGTTIVLIGAAREVGKMVYSVDPYPEDLEVVAARYPKGIMKQRKEKFKNNILNGSWENIVQFNEDLSNCINRIPDELSVCFIDGCHEISFVQKEFNLLLPKVVSGGYIYIHDIAEAVGQISNTKETSVSQILNLIRTIDNLEMRQVEGNLLCVTKR